MSKCIACRATNPYGTYFSFDYELERSIVAKLQAALTNPSCMFGGGQDYDHAANLLYDTVDQAGYSIDAVAHKQLSEKFVCPTCYNSGNPNVQRILDYQFGYWRSLLTKYGELIRAVKTATQAYLRAEAGDRAYIRDYTTTTLIPRDYTTTTRIPNTQGGYW